MTSSWQDIQAQARGDILAYMALLRPESMFGKHHYLFRDVIQDLAQRKRRFICLSCPPRHSKSFTFSQALPGWWLGNAPRNQVIATSYAASLAQSFGSAVRADMSSDLYGRLFGYDAQPSGRSSSGTDFSTNAGGKYRAVGVGGGLTGHGGDLIIADDLIKNAETADSPRYKDMLEKFFGQTLYTRLMPGGCIVVMMTRWRKDDLIGYVLKNFPDWEYINLTALAEDKDVLGRPAGAALWPEFYDESDLARIRGVLGERDFQAQYQGNPVASEAVSLKATALRFGKPGDVGVTGSFWSWDLALVNDWTVGQHWQVYADGSMALLGFKRFRGSFTDVCETIVNKFTEINADAVVIEHGHMGLAVRDQLAEDAPDMPVTLHLPKGSKLTRFQACLPMWRDGKLWLIDKADLESAESEVYDECIDELLKAGLTAHDDFRDALVQAVEHSKTGQVIAQPKTETWQAATRLAFTSRKRCAQKWR